MPFLDLGTTPLANDLPLTADQPETMYPLRLSVCEICWLVQMMDVVPHELVFGGDYTFFSGTSPGLVRYHEECAKLLNDRYVGDDARTVIEIACNDGDLLRHFADRGHTAIGIDPAAGPVAYAQDERGLKNVIHSSFTAETADQIIAAHGRARLVIANNVLAHVINLRDFLTGVHTLLADDGVASIEVQYLPDLLLGNQFDHVYHEHRYFFSLSSLTYVVNEVGLRVVNAEIVEQQGGSLRVTLARHGSAAASRNHSRFSLDLYKLDAAERLVRHTSAYAGMQMRAERTRERLLTLLDREAQAGRVVAGYGMPAKATTLLNFCGITQGDVQFIEDTTPAKIGRYAPGVKIPVIAPGERDHPHTYLVLVWNYLSGILRREAEFYHPGGRFIVPIPAPVIL